MNWGEVGKSLASGGLTLLGSLLGGPGGGMVGTLVGEALGLSDPSDPDKVSAAINADPTGAMAKLRELEAQRRHQLEVMHLELQMRSLEETQKTIRKDIASNDPLSKKIRALGLASIIVTVNIEILTGCAIAFVAPDRLGQLADFFTALLIPQSILASFFGIYVPLRSREKLADAGHAPGGGLLSAIIGGFKKETQ